MTDTKTASTSTCEAPLSAVVVDGADTEQSHHLLSAVATEINRRNTVMVAERTTEWTGPALMLVVENVDQLLTNRDSVAGMKAFRDFEYVLKFGRTFGVTGVARGPDASPAVIFGAGGLVREFLALGVPLRYEAAGDRNGRLVAALAG